MIRVQRGSKPSILSENEANWVNEIRQNLSNSIELGKAVAKYKHQEIKTSLKKLFNDKCAYCESKLSHVSWGDIEHFKPKSKFPLEAVVWDNLFLACSICNSAGYKGDAWPVSSNNEPLLINPCEEEPCDNLDFEYDENTNLAIVVSNTDKGQTSIKTYGLNRTELVINRTSLVKKLIVLAKLCHNHIEAQQILNEACEDKSEYAAFARMVKQIYA